MARQSCTMVPRWRFFASFLRPAFVASRAQHASGMHSKFALRPHYVWKYGRHPIWDGWDLARKEKRRRKKEQTTGQKYNVRICYTKGGHKNQVNISIRMWANAQRDGRPPNIDDALSSTPQSLADVPCNNAAKMRNPLKCARLSQTRQQISAANGPKFAIS